MHPEAMRAAAAMLAMIPVAGMRVLEIGAHDVNGSVRGHLPGVASITGLDLWPGRGVDIVADAATYVAPEPYDLIVSTETLEHAPDPAGIIARCYDNLRSGGWLVLTAAGPERAPHPMDGRSGPAPPGEHYANIDPDALAVWLAGWEAVTITRDTRAGDVYAMARRPEVTPC